MTVKRFDRSEIKKPTRLPNGWLKVDGYVGRTGLLEYMQADGSKWIEYRPPDEAFADQVLDSFDLCPLTNDHPPGGVLDASNTRQFQVGTVQRPQQDGKFARASIMITDADTITDVEAGKRELSMGYSCELDMTPGVFEGQRYDCVQRNIRGNHVAVVDHGRAGAAAKLHVDSRDQQPVGYKQVPGQRPTEKNNVLKIRIDGVTVEVSEQAAELIAKREAVQAEELKTAKAALEAQTAKADTATAQVAKLKAEIAEAPAKARKQLEDRAQLEADAKKINPDVKTDGTDLDVRKSALEPSGVKTEGKSDAYVEAAFDYALANVDAEPGMLARKPAKTARVTDAVDREDTLEAAQAAYDKRMRDASIPAEQ